MKLLVTGGGGQLGRSLVRRGGAHTVIALPRSKLDIRDPGAIEAALAAHAPDVVINAAGFTGVDAAELAPALASEVNARAAGLVACACAERGVPLLHVSTDYVFDGEGARPIAEGAIPAPLNAYGRSKAEGEQRVRDAGGTVVRTSWMFAAAGPSFVHTITRLALRDRQLRVVADQHGRPTWAPDLADALIALAAMPDRPPCVHVCGDGAATWHEFAAAIVEGVRMYRTIPCERVVPITTAEYVTPARRPAYSVLDTTLARELGLPIRPWRSGLARTLAEELA